MPSCVQLLNYISGYLHSHAIPKGLIKAVQIEKGRGRGEEGQDNYFNKALAHEDEQKSDGAAFLSIYLISLWLISNHSQGYIFVLARAG